MNEFIFAQPPILGLAMTTMALAGVTMIGLGMGFSAYTSYQSYKMQKDAMDAYNRRLKEAYKQAEDAATSFTEQLNSLSRDFDPYDMTEAYASLYEGVLLPLDRDLEENTLPELDATFGGGAFGSDFQSGKRRMAELEARMQHASNDANLRFQERNNMISRAYTDYERKKNVLTAGFDAEKYKTNTLVGAATGIYGAQQDTASAYSAMGNNISNMFMGLGGMGIGGMNAMSGGMNPGYVNALNQPKAV